MKSSADVKRTRRFWFYFVFTLISILVSFWSGFRLGRSVEKNEWLELVNPPTEKSALSNTYPSNLNDRSGTL